jgi:hypothetical protein
MITTLILTRKPDAIFQSTVRRTDSGRFGTLLVLQGGKITKARISTGKGSGGISVPTGVLDITAEDGAKVTELKRFTTIERMGGYIQLKPQEHNGKVYKKEPYGLRYESGNPVVSKLKGSGGKCFRVLGGLTAQEQAILIHAAPNVAWLIGCIGPRRLGDRSKGDTDSTYSAMAELFAITPRPSFLFVLDW